MNEVSASWPGRLCSRRTWLTFGLLALLPVLDACSLPGRAQAPSLQTYVLQASQAVKASAPAAARKCLSIRVSSPAAAPGFTTSRMAYTEQANRLDYFAYHEWVDTPARMLARLEAQGLDASGLFGAVLSGSPEIRTDLRLDSEMIRLLQEFTGSGNTLALDIKVTLVDVKSRSLLGSKRFSYSEAASKANPEAGVAAANRATDTFLADLLAFLEESIAPVACSSQP
jgi:cholesterol transport system auxiliary component